MLGLGVRYPAGAERSTITYDVVSGVPVREPVVIGSRPVQSLGFAIGGKVLRIVELALQEEEGVLLALQSGGVSFAPKTKRITLRSVRITAEFDQLGLLSAGEGVVLDWVDRWHVWYTSIAMPFSMGAVRRS